LRPCRPRPRPHRNGMTFVECMLAVTLLSGVFLAVSYTFVAAHQHLHHSDGELRAVRLGKDLMEEIVSSPAGYRDPFTRVSDYHGYTELPGMLSNFTGRLYPSQDQSYRRGVTVEPVEQSIEELNRSFSGQLITVTVTHQRGQKWEFVRFIPD
jgi:hypothetical protein